MIAEIPHVEPSAQSVADLESEEVGPIGPKQHILLQSSSEYSSQVLLTVKGAFHH